MKLKKLLKKKQHETRIPGGFDACFGFYKKRNRNEDRQKYPHSKSTNQNPVQQDGLQKFG